MQTHSMLRNLTGLNWLHIITYIFCYNIVFGLVLSILMSASHLVQCSLRQGDIRSNYTTRDVKMQLVGISL